MFLVRCRVYGNTIVTYAETGDRPCRRHWMTSEQMERFKATPVVFADMDEVADTMHCKWGMTGDDLIIEEVVNEKEQA